MKKLLALFLLANASLFAQQDKENFSTIEKGTWTIGGQMSFQSFKENLNFNSNDQERKTTQFSINPNASYAISENLLLGGIIGYTYNKAESGNPFTPNSTINNYRIGTYLKKYISIINNFAFNVQTELNYIYSKLEFDSDDFGSSNTFDIGFRPGLSLFLNNNFALETQIGFLGYSYSNTNRQNNNVPGGIVDGSSSSFNFNLNAANLFFGVTYFFR